MQDSHCVQWNLLGLWLGRSITEPVVPSLCAPLSVVGVVQLRADQCNWWEGIKLRMQGTDPAEELSAARGDGIDLAPWQMLLLSLGRPGKDPSLPETLKSL